jgi:hypothetical protein
MGSPFEWWLPMFTAAMLTEARVVEGYRPETDYSVTSPCFGCGIWYNPTVKSCCRS